MSIPIITPADFAALCRKGAKIDLIDVRTPAEFRERHIELARNVPLDQLDPPAVLRERGGSCDEPLYIICRSGSRGRQACERLIQAGCKNVLNVYGGTLACEAAGFRMVEGRKTISLERQVRIAAGALVLISTLLAWLVHPAFLALGAFVGAGLIFAGITDTCGMGLLLARMPWNRVTDSENSCGTPGH
jgi:rhodanese-related sulfurtransferase